MNKIFLTTPIAHRGLHDNITAENSLVAFSKALDQNYGIELDVHFLKDGEVAVFHDYNLERMTGKNFVIENLTSEELENFTLPDGQKIPLLSDVLTLIKNSKKELPLLIEVKCEGRKCKRFAETLIEKTKNFVNKGCLAFQSFNPLFIKQLKSLNPELCCGLLSSKNLPKKSLVTKLILSHLSLYTYSNAEFVSYDINYLPNKFVDGAKDKGAKVFAWTINSKEKQLKAKHVADNIIFENIEI